MSAPAAAASPAPPAAVPRRRRWRLLKLCAFLVIALLVVVFVARWWVERYGHGYAQEIWTAHFVRDPQSTDPGVLAIGRIEIASPQLIRLHDISLREHARPFAAVPEPVATISTIIVHLDVLHAQATRIEIRGARLRLDGDSFAFIQRLADAEARIPGDPTRAPTPLRVEVSGEAVIASGTVLSNLAIALDTLGPQVNGSIAGRIGPDPFRLLMSTETGSGGARVYRYRAEQATTELGPVLDALHTLRILDAPVSPGLRAWMPRRITLDGTDVANDPRAHSYAGAIQAQWENGSFAATLRDDRRRVELRAASLADAGLGEFVPGSGLITFDRTSGEFAVRAEVVRIGKRVPIPPEIPVEPLLTLMPRLHVVVPVRDSAAFQADLRLAGSGESTVQLLFPRQGALRVRGESLPLILGARFLPAWLTIGGGTAQTLHVEVGERLERLSIDLVQARVTSAGWSFGPTDGRLLIAHDIGPGAPNGALGLEIDITSARDAQRSVPVQVLARVGCRLGAERTDIRLVTPGIEALLARLHGSVPLPDLRGGVDTELVISRDDGQLRLRVPRLDVRGLGVPDLLRGIDANLRQAELRLAGSAVILRLGGQIQGGELIVAGDPLPLAAATPIFTVDAQILPPGEGPSASGKLEIGEILVRAGGLGGEPSERGYSAQLRGQIQLGGPNTPGGEGSFSGVIDHADLGWILDRVRFPGITVSGDGAAVFTATLAKGQLRGLRGSFLPLSADLGLGAVSVKGVSGRIEFTVGEP